MSLNKYVAFLRGINVGGHLVKMDRLKKTFEEMGFSNIKTVIASGNVIFESKELNPDSIKESIEKKLENEFGFKIGTIIRNKEEIAKLVDSDPFKKIQITPQTRLYVSFLSNGSSMSKPKNLPVSDFRILNVLNSNIASMLTLTKIGKTTELMAVLEKTFGKGITTRNWNTVIKIAKILEE